MNILLISYSYAPMVSTQAFRWTPVAEELARRGHEVTVVAGCEPGNKRHELGNGIEIHRVGGRIIERFRAAYNESREQVQSLEPGPGKKTGIASASLGILKRAHDLSWKKIYWPDAHCTWSLPAISCARKVLRKRKIDAIISVAFPFTSLLVGLVAARQQPAARWLCDMSDPFSYLQPTPPNNLRLYDGINRSMEARVFERANAVTVTCDQTAQQYTGLYPEWQTKFSVVPHLLCAEPVRTGSRAAAFMDLQPKSKKLVFTGILDGRIRNPRPLLDACRRIAERGSVPGFQLHLYGMIRDCETIFEEFRECRDKWLFVHGLVEKPVADKAVAEADVLVNIGNRYQCQLPSKLVDYGSTGKPILNVIGCPTDLTIGALKGYTAVLHLLSTEGKLVESQIDELEQFITRQQPLTDEVVNAWTQRFRLPAIVTMYEQLIG